MSPSAVDLNRTGASYFLQGNYDAARMHYAAALHAEPNFLPAMKNLASVLGEQRNYDAAIALGQRIVTIAPREWQIWTNLGMWLMVSFRYDEALVAMRTALSLMPTGHHELHNMALLAHRNSDEDSALAFLDRIVALGGSTAQILNDRAHVLLKQGKSLHEALVAYEDRWPLLQHDRPWDFHIPEWKGESLNDKRLLLSAEQGYGDSIMCARFVRDLVKLGAQVTLAIHPALIDLLLGMDVPIAAIDITNMPNDTGDHFDFHSPMYSALRWLGVEWDTIDPSPYISVPTCTTPDPDTDLFNVGICWASGSRGTDIDYFRRVTSLSDWLQLASIPNVQLWSLLKGSDSDEIIQVGAEGLVRDITPSLKDWADTANFVSKLDLVITVDTAVAHLAGAIGTPCWMAAQHASCWRWQDIMNGTGLPWYRGMKIRRQPSPLDWKTPLREFTDDLRALMSSKSRLAA